MTALLDGSPLSARQRKWVVAGRAASAAVLSVIDNVLDSARLEAGQLALDPQRADVRGIVRAATDIVRLTAAQKNLRLEETVAASVPEEVVVDAARLRQVLINLLANAVKFTDVGGVTLDVDAARVPGTSDATLRFVVSVTGIGIEPDRLPLVFDSFRQADVSTCRRFGGSGLGLSISKRLAELLGGDLSVQSRPGVGSAFTFTCRAALPAAEAEPPAREVVAAPGTEPRPAFSTVLDDIRQLPCA
jgi:two-component system sensor histidine kinase EvgS